MNDIEQAKVVLIGDANTGKTSIVQKYVSNTFDDHSTPTIGSTFLSKVVDFDKKSIKLCVWDTAGQERYYSLAASYARDARVCLLIYDITSIESFKNLERWHKSIKDQIIDNAILVIVGNKEDLIGKEAVRLVDARAFADSIGAAHVRVSAKQGTGIEEMFTDVCRDLLGCQSLKKMPSYRSTTSVKLNAMQINTNNPKKKCC